MKSNINFRTPRVYTKDIILQYKNVQEKITEKKASWKERGREQRSFVYHKLINKTIFLRSKAKKMPWNLFFFLLFFVSSLCRSFCLLLLLFFPSQRKNERSVFSFFPLASLRWKSIKQIKIQLREYLILIEFLFFNFRLSSFAVRYWRWNVFPFTSVAKCDEINSETDKSGKKLRNRKVNSLDKALKSLITIVVFHFYFFHNFIIYWKASKLSLNLHSFDLKVFFWFCKYSHKDIQAIISIEIELHHELIAIQIVTACGLWTRDNRLHSCCAFSIFMTLWIKKKKRRRKLHINHLRLETFNAGKLAWKAVQIECILTL